MILITILSFVILGIFGIKSVITSPKDYFNVIITSSIILLGSMYYILSVKQNLVDDGYGRYNSQTGEIELDCIGAYIYSSCTWLVYQGTVYERGE